MNYGVTPAAKKYVALWLYLIAAMVLGMVVIGGLTRLTDSGLSMVDWKPIMGVIPPLSEGDWQQTFEKYRQFPEYKIHNRDMTLQEFKFIFWMEFSHRLLGRFIGLIFLIPFLFFLAMKWLGPPMIRRAILLFFLGLLQGFMGWYMVKSGLIDIPRVSPYRLTVHLSLATLVYSLGLWFAFSLTLGEHKGPCDAFGPARNMAIWVLVLIGLQICSGGFVAGLNAGLSFNTFPTMNGAWIPGGLWSHAPWFANFFDNPVMVQFIHRGSAYLVTAVTLLFYFRHGRLFAGTSLSRAFHILLVLLIVQLVLGITTLLGRVPISLASLHQVGALALWSSALFLCHRFTHIPKVG